METVNNDKVCFSYDTLKYLIPVVILLGAYFLFSKFIFTAAIVAVLTYLYFNYK